VGGFDGVAASEVGDGAGEHGIKTRVPKEARLDCGSYSPATDQDPWSG